jgi:hypothetical protein
MSCDRDPDDPLSPDEVEERFGWLAGVPWLLATLLALLLVCLSAGWLRAAPAPLSRAERPAPEWPAGRTLHHEQAAVTVSFHAAGACLVECNGVIFPGRWWLERHVLAVAYGTDEDGRPFYLHYRRP